MSKILRINTRTKEYSFEELGKYAGLGGRALTSRVVLNEVPATCHALSAANKLVIAGGILAGTTAANSGRSSVGAKSPLTGGIKESNVGGQFAHKLPRLGLQAIIFEDKPEADAPFVTVVVKKDTVEFLDAAELVGKGNYAAHDLLKAKFGEKVVTAIVGPAGEQSLMASTIQFSDPDGRPSRSAGRGGMGAVLGSKKIKAVVLDPDGKDAVVMADPEKFKVARKRWVDILMGHPVTSQGLPTYGTAILVNIINEAGALPTKNFRSGRFDGAAKISGEAMTETIKARKGQYKHGCHTGCVIQCSQVYNDKNGDFLTTGFEYETIWGFGANILVDNLDDIAMMDRTCDEAGMDTIEMANTIAMAMEAGVVAWGDGKGVIDLLRKVGTKDPLGRILGNGTVFTAQAFGVDRVPVVKKQALPAYDPRVVKGVGVTYCTTPMGADHTAGYAVCQNVLKVGGDVPSHGKAGQVEVSKNLQVATAAVDSLGLCLFVAFAVLDTPDALGVVADLVSSYTGKPYSVDDIVNLGANCLKDELAFNVAAGFTTKDDQLPDFFKNEKLPPHDLAWDFTAEEMQASKV
ncbi:MAG: aldehyde ferredoxin oxidoreductase C-terminal domain-containing protein [Humidesulfovibrio sp.]|jgi:aldehyde:ferredoxin oxidoreductase|uniref:aldehyde ferredoxin oxidoreductase family protein n=1 Tax=Humidesulfovibrio sp. TaxID=2910988 RepID=UPI0027363454|nr:aldehyde ferredoxin oxidoreductase C-terminal domain-containing protein [Humidesulfovibrio sp.]MDP2847851.1 aldehyde ferredoxin oxidoreductase C-terminal domain-containing protein [Humidesulfovibrio sp.]